MKETYKPYETEEHLDYFFYRPLASLIVKGVINTSVTPNQLTWASLIFGVISGFFFSKYFSNALYLYIGILLLLISNVFDCSDGQLARARGTAGSMAGRTFDGLVDNLVFFSIYYFTVTQFQHLSFLKLDGADSYGWTIWAVGVVASVGHSLQSSFFDYYRNEYIAFVSKDYKSESVMAQTIKQEILSLEGVRGKGFDRFLLWFYYWYTKIQERSNKKNALRDRYNIPTDFDQLYQKRNQLLLRLWSFLGATAHITYIMIFAAFDRMDLYFFFEAIILNIYMITLKIIQNRVIHNLEKDLVPIRSLDPLRK